MTNRPHDLVPLGYLHIAEIRTLRDNKIRSYCDWTCPINGQYLVFVEPWIFDIKKVYTNLNMDGQTFAGLSEWEFIVASAPGNAVA
jgi:hypothetical protein